MNEQEYKEHLDYIKQKVKKSFETNGSLRPICFIEGEKTKGIIPLDGCGITLQAVIIKAAAKFFEASCVTFVATAKTISGPNTGKLRELADKIESGALRREEIINHPDSRTSVVAASEVLLDGSNCVLTTILIADVQTDGSLGEFIELKEGNHVGPMSKFLPHPYKNDLN